GAYLFGREAAAGDHAAHLFVLRAVDYADPIAALLPVPGLNQQRYCQHDVGRRGGVAAPAAVGAEQGVEDRLEASARIRAGKRERAHGGTIKRAAAIDQGLAEQFADAGDGPAAATRQFVCDRVGIHHGGTKCSEAIGCSAFATADTSGETDDERAV